MTIDLRVDNDTLTIARTFGIVSGSKNYYRVTAAFSPDWNGLSKFLILSFNGGEFSAVEFSSSDSGGEETAVLPEGLIQQSGALEFGIIGKENDTLRISTNLEKLKILRGASETSCLPPVPDEEGSWSEYVRNAVDSAVAEIPDASASERGLMSSSDKAYLTDLISNYWNKEKLPMYTTPDPAEGWMVNWLFDTGWYLGGIKKECGGHPPVQSNNYTSWAILVLNGMNTEPEGINHNHRLQIAFDVVNSRIYMRRGWISENTWADEWTDAGAVTAGSVSFGNLSEALQSEITALESKAEELNESLTAHAALPHFCWDFISERNCSYFYDGNFKFKKGQVFIVEEDFTFYYYRDASVNLHIGDLIVALKDWSSELTSETSWGLFSESCPAGTNPYLSTVIPTAAAKVTALERQIDELKTEIEALKAQE